MKLVINYNFYTEKLIFMLFKADECHAHPEKPYNAVIMISAIITLYIMIMIYMISMF